MICSKCGKENAEGMQFCNFCGNNLESKVQCTKCGTWVEPTCQYCPFCAQKLNKDQTVEPVTSETAPAKQRLHGRVDRNKLVAIIVNSLVILFSTLMVVFMFGKLAVLAPDDFDMGLPAFKVDLFDYVETTINGLSDYDAEDFSQKFNEPIGTEEDRIELLSKINFLNVFVINELDKDFILERIFIFVNLIIVIAMMVLPLVALGFSIYDLVKFRKRELGKKLFIFSFLSGLILVITTMLMLGYKSSVNVILYLVFAALGLLSYYVLENVARERKFVGKVFATRLVTLLALVLLFILSTATVATFDTGRKLGSETENYTMDFNFSGFIGSLDHFENENLGYFVMVFFTESIRFVSVTSGEEVVTWDNYIHFGFAILMLTVIGLLIASIIVETSRTISLKPKKPSSTHRLTWVAFGFEILALFTIISIAIIYNYYFKTVVLLNEIHTEGYTFKIGAGIIALMVCTLATAIYQTVTFRIQSRTACNI